MPSSLKFSVEQLISSHRPNRHVQICTNWPSSSKNSQIATLSYPKLSLLTDNTSTGSGADDNNDDNDNENESNTSAFITTTYPKLSSARLQTLSYIPEFSTRYNDLTKHIEELSQASDECLPGNSRESPKTKIYFNTYLNSQQITDANDEYNGNNDNDNNDDNNNN
ncbi:unnamed protein product [Thelazia callipaeda]|uniref:Kinesin motor domain-containing protein n=1 Tax=Thelazia callipaeda TaxID=103827 RepID=A0A0N5CJA1_THECL|nr:unnamed protein product [Thelazia callipaeda]